MCLFRKPPKSMLIRWLRPLPPWLKIVLYISFAFAYAPLRYWLRPDRGFKSSRSEFIDIRGWCIKLLRWSKLVPHPPFLR